MDLHLRPSTDTDLAHFFLFQLDPEGRHLAAFTAPDTTDKNAYMAKYTQLLQDPSINNQTILVDGMIVGSIAKFIMEGEAEITYWLAKDCWGKGIATKALHKFLEVEATRPIYGRVAFDNFGSQKVLEKCGFARIGAAKGFAHARQAAIEEFIYKLEQ